jgi:tRNA pseudouridine55 synthase
VISGLVVVDKAAGWTSHDVVAKVRGLLGERRVGHAGTLDPSATGVLLLGVGRVTRLLRFVGAGAKEYTGEVVLGAETSTLDADGEVVATHDMSGVSLDDVRAAAVQFVGRIEQVPPMVSAVKVGGRRLHQLARKGEEVERDARTVEVERFEVEPGDAAGVYRIDVRCSPGTYVRTLAADLGHALGGGAHLRNLRRTAVDPFTLAEAVPVEQVTQDRLLPPADALRGMPPVTVDADVANRVANGAVLPPDGFDGPGPWAVLSEGQLLAVYERRGGDAVKPAVVVSPHQ